MRDRITRISASAFRGIPHRFDVSLSRGQSIIIFGENGTGKSSIADIVELFLTGAIEFLNKEGRSHAIRHVGADKERKTTVEVTTTGSLGGQIDYPVPKGWHRVIS